MQGSVIERIIPKGAAVLAPMAGVSDRSFRAICRRFDCAFTFTEMVSAKGLYYSGEGSRTLLELANGENAVGIQIFGNDAGIMARMAAWVEMSMGSAAAIIDINMGCPAPKIVKNGDGAALMTNTTLAEKIVSAVVKAVKCPVSVKIRAGWDAGNLNAVEFALAAQDSGAAMVTVHGRTRDQYYSGRVNLGIIKRVVRALSIPVIGNGDIKTVRDYETMLGETGCHAVMIGRGAQGNPWIFKQIEEQRNGGVISSADWEERLNVALAHARLAVVHKGENAGIREMRKHLGWYLKGAPNSARLRTELNRTSDYDGVADLLNRWYKETGGYVE